MAADTWIAALDEVLVPAGFAPAQGDGRTSGQVIWCAAYDEFQQSFPHLPQAHDQDDLIAYACVDLVVEVDGGVITHVNLEGPSLAGTFEALGRPEHAERSTAVVGLPVAEAAVPLAALLRSLLSGR